MSRFRTTRRALLAGGGALAVGGTGWWGYGEWERAAAEKDILSWMKDNSRRFDSASPASIMADGAMLRALAGAQVIGIGEATHGSHEDVACKAEIIKGLIKADAIGTIFLEANAAGGRQLDAFIAGGEGSARERVVSADIFRILKADPLIDIVDWLRSWNRSAKTPVRIVGVDCQATSPDTVFTLDWLRTVDPAAAEGFARRLDPVISPAARAKRFPELISSLTARDLQACLEALKQVQDLLAPAGPHANAQGRAEAAQSARAAWQGLKAFELETSDGRLDGDLGEYFGRRDLFMADNIRYYADERAGAYWAHNTHVAGAPMSYGSDVFKPSGHHLRQALGDRYRVVLFEYATARFNAVPAQFMSPIPPATSPKEVIDWPYRSGRLAGLFRSLGGGDAWVDLTTLPKTPAIGAWTARQYSIRAPGYAASHWVDLEWPGRIAARPAIDVLVHIEALTPSRMRN